MEPLKDLLVRVAQAGLHVEQYGEHLRVRGPQKAGSLAKEILDRKDEVLAALSRGPPPGDGTETSSSSQNPVVSSPPPLTEAHLRDTESGHVLDGTLPGNHPPGDQGAATRVALSLWDAALSDTRAVWDAYVVQCQSVGREPTWLDGVTLTEQVGAAIRAGDVPGTRVGIEAWQAAWNNIIDTQSPFEPSWAPIPVPVDPSPALLAHARRFPARDLNAWLAAPDPGRQEAARRELHARADQILEEVDGLRLPPNPTVHAMLRDARERFGFRDVDERSITAWLRKNAPVVAALWPEAPLEASWLDWRQRVVTDHVPTLDAAWKATSVGTQQAVMPARGNEPGMTGAGIAQERTAGGEG